jgi:molybdate-binding protein
LVLAGCDPAVGILAELLRPARVRLLPFVRSSGRALELLRERRVHVAGLHLGETVDANEREVRARLGSGYRLLSLASWREGVAFTPGTGLGSVAGLLGARLRWVGREPGSGARRCLDELLDGRDPPEGYDHLASDHRGVVETIRTGWAQAGVCVELAAEEGGLDFLPVRTEAYDLCFPTELEGDPRIRALVEVVRSGRFRGLVGALPGYDAA